MTEPDQEIRFISAGVLQRLKDGSFVPQRRSKAGSMLMGERRSVVSPLAVSKRCVRYDSYVFLNRKTYITGVIEALNSSEQKLVLISGPQGCGKTSLARGVIELMGGGKEQLLWFDVSSHTDSDALILFIVEYLTLVASELRLDKGDDLGSPLGDVGAESGAGDPFLQLERLLETVMDIPLLIVIDNVEHVVNADYSLRSAPLKETFNFLLSFPNIKMLLAGERLPYADMSANSAMVHSLKLQGLPESVVLPLLQKKLISSHNPDEKAETPEYQKQLLQLYQYTKGYPWLLKTMFYLSKVEHPVFSSLEIFNQRLAQAVNDDVSSVDALVQMIYNGLSPEEQDVAQVLALLRHPVNFDTLVSMSRFCKPGLMMNSSENFEETLDHSILKPLMKRTFPPQEMLAHIRKRHQAPKTFQPCYELYRQVKKALYRCLSLGEKNRIHRAMQDFYLKEKNKPLGKRVYRSRTKSLLREARFHGNAARKRREGKSFVASEQALSPYLYGRVTGVPNTSALVKGELSPDIVPEVTVITGGVAAETSGVIFQDSIPKEPEPEDWSELSLTEEEKSLLLKAEAFDESGYLEAPEFTDPLTLGLPDSFNDSSALEKVKEVRDDVTVGFKEVTSELVTEKENDSVAAVLKEKMAMAVLRQDKSAVFSGLLALAVHRQSKGLLNEALECLKKAASLKQHALEGELAVLYLYWGELEKERYRYPAAVVRFQQAVEVFKRLKASQNLTAEEWERLALVYDHVADIESSRLHYHDVVSALFRAAEAYEQSGNALKVSESYFRLAQAYDALGQSENAVNHYEHSYVLDKQEGNTAACSITLANIGSIYLDSENWEQALRYFKASLRYDQQHGYVEGRFQTLSTMAQAYAGQGRFKQALAQQQKALVLATSEEHATWKASAYLGLGDLYFGNARWADALSHYQKAYQAAPLAELSETSRMLLIRKIEEAKSHVADL